MRNGDILSFYWRLSAKIVCIWFSVWLIRRQAEIDYPLDTLAHVIRWGVVAVGFWVGYYADNPYVRVGGWFLGLGFICWPNFAYHLANLFRRRVDGQDRS
ncbi:MAG: hypothetical protein LAP21_10050 [Acidobacteriia bacterium]|nr:hypothetical protein [Terriglobia bacterium]